MSIWTLMPAGVHGVADYGSALALILVALIVGGWGVAVATGVGAGLVLVAVSLLTDYPLGAVKLIPFRLHSAGDYLRAVGLVGAPFLLGFSDTDPGLSAFYVVTGVTLVAVSLVTDYGDGAQRRLDPSSSHSGAVCDVDEPVARGLCDVTAAGVQDRQ